MRMAIPLATALLALSSATISAQQTAKVDPATIDQVIMDTFEGAPPEWRARIVPDETLRLCSQFRGELPAADHTRLREAALASIVYPADGQLLGDWKKGRQLAQRGTGGQFSDTASTPKGANCYACHQLSRAEVSFGTLGPSLLEYGRIRKFKAEDAKAAFAKIYNAHAMQPCSNMPRFGHNKFLSLDEIKDLTAYLFDPESPVNK